MATTKTFHESDDNWKRQLGQSKRDATTIPEKEFREYSGLPTAIASTVPSSSAL
jgi:hypothetical protein